MQSYFRDSRETRFKQWCVKKGDNVKMNTVALNSLLWYISTLVCWVTGRSLASRLLSSSYVLTTVIIVRAILVAHELPFDFGRAALTVKRGTEYYMHATAESIVVSGSVSYTDACCRMYGCTYSVSRYICPYFFFYVKWQL